MADPREVEIKLEMSPDDAAAFGRENSELLGQSGKREKLSSVYFDTPKLALQKKGLSLRVRSTKNGHVQTVKARNGASSGLFDRSEWETPIESREPDQKAWSGTPVGDAISKGKPLKPIFETVVDRTSWVVAAGRSTVEVALDRGRVVAGLRDRPFAELELELKQGTPADLFDLARKLGSRRALKLGVLSKSERGYALAADERPTAFKAEPVALEPDMRAAEAFRAVVHSCLRQFRLNEQLVIETRAVESLHEARVGMRRLRSALSLFGDLVADEALEGLKERLRTASQQFGDARNLDVYLERAVVPERERDPAEPGIDAFLSKVRALREQAYAGVIATLNSPEFRGLMLDLLTWVETGPWSVDEDPARSEARNRPVTELAADILDARHRKVRKKGRHLDHLEPDARHRVRIQAKKLRYAAEFFSGLVRKSQRRHYDAFLKGMKSFQEVLGELNDLHTGHELAADLARQVGSVDPGLLFAAGHLSGEQDERVGALLKTARKAYDEFSTAPKFWRDWA